MNRIHTQLFALALVVLPLAATPSLAAGDATPPATAPAATSAGPNTSPSATPDVKPSNSAAVDGKIAPPGEKKPAWIAPQDWAIYVVLGVLAWAA